MNAFDNQEPPTCALIMLGTCAVVPGVDVAPFGMRIRVSIKS